MIDRRTAARAATRAATAVVAFGAAAGCVPHAAPLAGALAPRSARLPRVELPPVPRRITFTWRYDEQDGFSARGDGVARISPPDTAQLQFFLGGGFAGGAARMIGNELDIPDRDIVRRLLPAPPLLWAALGRLALPAATDTTLRQSADTLRGDIGRAPTWRVTLVRDSLRLVERIDDGRVTERLERTADHVTYHHEIERRTLRIDVVCDTPLAAQQTPGG